MYLPDSPLPSTTTSYSSGRVCISYLETKKALSIYCESNAGGRCFRNQALAESAITTRAAPIIIASLITSRPAPLKNGKPWLTSPSGGTQHAGVVTRKESVTSDITNTKNPPSAATCGSHGWRQSINPYSTITAPRP